jgi:hypothetical protein
LDKNSFESKYRKFWVMLEKGEQYLFKGCLFPIIDYSMPKENNEDREEAQAAISDTGKDIKIRDGQVCNQNKISSRRRSTAGRRLYEV